MRLFNSLAKWRRFMGAIIAAAGLLLFPGISQGQGQMLANCGLTSFDYDSNLLTGQGGSCAAPFRATGNEWSAQAYVGLSFSIGGDGLKPHLNAGVRGVNVNSEGTVYGAETYLSLSLVDGLKDTQLRVVGLAGNTSILASGGVGWDVEKHSFILNAGAQVPYVRGFVDFTISDQTLRAFLEANSYARLDLAAEALTCGAGTRLDTPAEALGDIASLFPGAVAVGDLFGGYVSNGAIGNLYGAPNAAVFVAGKTCFATPDMQSVPPD